MKTLRMGPRTTSTAFEEFGVVSETLRLGVFVRGIAAGTARTGPRTTSKAFEEGDCVPEGRGKLAGGDNHRFTGEKNKAPDGASESCAFTKSAAPAGADVHCAPTGG